MKAMILDGTLRDGGYVNDWKFSENTITYIISNLVSANIDFIELGFLKKEGIEGTSLFDGISCGKNYIKKYITNFPNQKFSVMMNVGELKNYEFIKNQIQNNLFVRLAFRKNVLPEALDILSDLTKAGVNTFFNPMFTNSYSSVELQRLLCAINDINPYCLSIVDTAGSFSTKDLIKTIKFVDKHLNKTISLAFHSHNNLNLSFQNSTAILDLNLDRKVILESCIGGMGRGAGNLDTIKIARFLKNYNTHPLQSIVNKVTKPIYRTNPWGISNALYQTAKLGFHPDYATLLESQNIKPREFKKILTNIPEQAKYKFDASQLKLTSKHS